MNDKLNIKTQVNDVYEYLVNIANLDIILAGNYVSAIISLNSVKNDIENIDTIIDRVFWKMILELSKHITEDDMSFIIYKSYCLNDPSEDLIKDCFKIVNNELINKKSSNETTIYDLLEKLKNKYDSTEIAKSLDTVFDILLDYYSIVRK